MRLFASLAILTVSPLLAAPVPKEANKAATRDGTWQVTERHLNGIRDDSMSPIRWTIDGKSLIIEMHGKAGFRRVARSTYRLVKPKGGLANEIDYELTPDDKDIPPSTYRSLVEHDGDTLKICVPGSPQQGRPTECKPLSGTDFYVFKRVKEEKYK